MFVERLQSREKGGGAGEKIGTTEFERRLKNVVKNKKQSSWSSI
jgi:hypothetical protein